MSKISCLVFIGDTIYCFNSLLKNSMFDFLGGAALQRCGKCVALKRGLSR